MAFRTTGVYVNLQLDPTKAHIRLLDLELRVKGKQLAAKLRVVSLEDKPRYEALSYTWGTSKRDSTMCINDVYAIAISDNLERALLQMRYRWRKRTMWVDQLCINQLNNLEKGQQVAMMWNIFASARRTLVWLGDVENKVPRILCRETWAFMYQLLDGMTRYPQSRSSLIDWPGKIGEMLKAIYYILRDAPDVLHQAIHLSRPKWHDRIWIRPEIVASRDLSLHYANRSARWFPSIVQTTVNAAPLAEERVTFWPLTVLSALRSDHHNGLGANLIAACASAMEADASDPRDKVFAILGLISARERDFIGAVDYRLPIARVYARATYASIRCQGLHIMSLVRLSRRPDMPSWALDLTERRELSYETWAVSYLTQDNGLSFGLSRAWSLYHTAESRPDEVQESSSAAVNALLSDEDRTLSLLALHIDTVKFTAQFANIFGDEYAYNTAVECRRILEEVGSTEIEFSGMRRAEMDSTETKSTEMKWTKSKSTKTRRSPDISRLPLSYYLDAFWLLQTHSERHSSLNHSLSNCKACISAEKSWFEWARIKPLSLPFNRNVDYRKRSALDSYLFHFHQTMCLAIFQSRFLGFAQQEVRPGDRLILPINSNIPIFVRPAGSYWDFVAVGHIAYLDNNELLRRWATGETPAEEYHLR